MPPSRRTSTSERSVFPVQTGVVASEQRRARVGLHSGLGAACIALPALRCLHCAGACSERAGFSQQFRNRGAENMPCEEPVTAPVKREICSRKLSRTRRKLHRMSAVHRLSYVHSQARLITTDEKGKPVERRRRKATGLQRCKAPRQRGCRTRPPFCGSAVPSLSHVGDDTERDHLCK